MKKRLFIVLALSFCSAALFAQSLEEGIKYYHADRAKTASGIFEQCVQKSPGDITGWYWLIRSYQATDQPAKAQAALAKIPASMSDNPLYKVMQGMIALQNGDTILAKSNWTAAIGTARKKDPAIQLAVAEANIDLAKGSLSYALELLDEAAKRDNNNAVIYLAKGDAFRKLYNGTEAYRNYIRASELVKNDPVIYYKLGKIYQSQDNPGVFLDYYNKAIQADANFGPVYYQLYYYYYYHDLTKAFDYLQKYLSHTDPDPKNDYLLTDFFYVSKKYDQSIAEAKKLIARDGDKSKPRLYRLLAYSQDAVNDSAHAYENMKRYLEKVADTSYVPEDFELMAKLSDKNNQKEDAAIWYEKSFLMEKDQKKKTDLARKMIAYFKKEKNYDKQAYWYRQLDAMKAPMNNIDIFNWGLVSYNAKNYAQADTIFARYETKYPEQTFGYYWRARSNAAMDTAMETGIAIPHYENLIKVAEKDTVNANNRKWLIQAYGYIAAFKVNKEKLYNDAMAYYDKILVLDPANSEAEKYKEVLEKMIGSKTTADKAVNN